MIWPERPDIAKFKNQETKRCSLKRGIVSD